MWRNWASSTCSLPSNERARCASVIRRQSRAPIIALADAAYLAALCADADERARMTDMHRDCLDPTFGWPDIDPRLLLVAMPAPAVLTWGLSEHGHPVDLVLEIVDAKPD